MSKLEDQINQKQTGVITVTPRGIGYLTVDGLDEDVEIQERYLQTALHGDTVEITLHPRDKSQSRQQGEVKTILSRAKEVFVGTLDIKKNTCFLLPDDRRMYRDIFISNPPSEAKNKDKAVVKLTDWTDPKKNPEGEIKEILGPVGEHEVEMNSIIVEKGFQVAFPTKVDKEAEKIYREFDLGQEIKDRKDLRSVLTCTIDPVTAKDFDDALSIEEVGDGLFEVGIHIADVAYFVKAGSVLDREARHRGTSVYLVDRTIPMLPEVLSNDLCSLNPEEDKMAFSAIFTLDSEAKVQKRWFGRSVIRSDKRLTYREAQDEIDSGESQLAQPLRQLNHLARKLRQQKSAAGAIDFETDEVEFKLDDKGTPIQIKIKERLEVHKLIEEFMLLANREVATFLRDSQSGKNSLIYRIHDKPDPDRLEELFVFMRALGHDIEINSKEVSPKDISALLNKVNGQTEESLVKTAALRSMSKAIYSTKNIGHFGLAFSYYTHFTSPIRRYPDLVVHRLLAEKLSTGKISNDQLTSLEVIARESTEKEIRATEAERESIKLKQVEFMANHLGEVFDAIISGVTEWGFYVEEQSTRSNGMVHVSQMGDDYFELDRENYRLIGRKSNQSYSLGQAVKVKLTEADPKNRLLSFTLA